MSEIEQRISMKTDSIYHFYDPPTNSISNTSSSSSSSQVISLYNLISTKKVQLQKEKESLEIEQLTSERAFWEYVKVFYFFYIFSFIFLYYFFIIF